jgi:hypothetical protein
MPQRRGKPDGRFIVHNVYVGQHPDSAVANLLRLAERFDPDGFLLQESMRLTGHRVPGYRTLSVPAAERSHADDGNCRVLVREDGVAVRDSYVVRVQAPGWRGPKHGLPHPPRVFVGGALDLDPDAGWRRELNLLSVHRMPGGPTSRLQGGEANWRGEHEALVRFADGHDGVPLLLGGDWNVRTTNRHPLGLAGLARRIGAVVRVKGIDGVLAVGFERVEVRQLFRRYGSDQHRPVVVDVWLPEQGRG